MRTGQRVVSREGGEQGVLLRVQFPLTPAMTEVQVRWDDGETTWQMGEELNVIPNLPGDAFVAMGNGFGVRAGETAPEQPDLRSNQATEAELFLRERFGLMVVRHPAQIDKARQLTLDIRIRVRTGTPTRGSVQRPDKRKLALAAAVAAGQAQLVRRGRLWLTPKPLESNKPKMSASLERLLTRKRLTLQQKRRLRAAKARSKK